MLKRIPLDLIERNPNQPRQFFDAKALGELAASIRENGLMQPITVRPIEGDRYMIVAGERRYRAHLLLQEQGHAQDILCNVRTMDEETMAIEAILENLQRADVKPMEEARAFQAMLDRGYTVETLAKKLGISQPRRISDRLLLLALEPENQKLLDSEAINIYQAYELARLDSRNQTKIVRMISAGQLPTLASVKAAVQAIVDRLSQVDIFGDLGRVTEEETETVNRMEAKITKVADMVSAGWKDGECVIARKVSPDRAAKMAEQIAAIRTHLGQMERQLRQAAAQAAIALDSDAA